MKVITHNTTVYLEKHTEIMFEWTEARISFKTGDFEKKLYFESRGKTMEFILDIIEGLYNEIEELDLTHYMPICNYYNMVGLRRMIEERLERESKLNNENI